MYQERQPKFLNCVFRGKSLTGPFELLEKIREIEEQAGRDRRSSGWMGPRPIDIDILLFGSKIVETQTLTIPHPLMHERGFVLKPLADIAGEVVHPSFGMTIQELLAVVSLEGIREIEEDWDSC